MNRLRDLVRAKDRFILALIIVFALGLRLIYVGAISKMPIDNRSDERDYDHIGLSLAAGKGFINIDGEPTSRRAPLPSVFFALVYMIFGHNITAVRIAQALLSSLTCFIIYLLGKDIFSKKVGLFSAAISAIYPSFIAFTAKLLSETVLVFLIVISVYLLLKKHGSRNMNFFLAGISFGLASLTRPSLLLLPFAIIFVSGIFDKLCLRGLFKKIAILTIGIAIIIMPWTLRNCHIHKQFVLINTRFGYTFLCSYFYPKAGFGFQDQELQGSLTKGVHNEVAQSKILARYTIDRIMNDPVKFIRIFPLKFMWFWDPFDGKGCGFRSSYNIIYGLVATFFLFGLIGSRVMWKVLLPIYTIIGYFVILALIFYGSSRFRLQIEPFIIILASYGVFWVAERWRRRNITVSTLLIIGLIINLLFFSFTDNIKIFSKKMANIFGYDSFPKDT